MSELDNEPAKGNSRNSGYDRVANDWYQEPAWAVEALLDAETFDGHIWDPACGGGNIPEVCMERDLSATGSDIVDRGYGGHTYDFLGRIPCYYDENIITNPPYGLAEKFIHRALNQTSRKVAMLVRAAFLEGQGRHERLYRPHPPARIWQFVRRVSMPPGGTTVKASGGSVAYVWIVWDKQYQGPTIFGWLP